MTTEKYTYFLDIEGVDCSVEIASPVRLNPGDTIYFNSTYYHVATRRHLRLSVFDTTGATHVVARSFAAARPISYESCYGKVVTLHPGEHDWSGIAEGVSHDQQFVITKYEDSFDELVGIYPLYEDGYTVSELLSTQRVKYIVQARYLAEVVQEEEKTK
ncbi:hypothetical protein [Bacillus phage SDFMU_Pbc]|uniref:Uncharacterized protein n=1 Tax=Bacillus phage SDFMU_Pbc TaxID=3076135 RepID=A0AA96KS03_9CAUD|nr:hypothetical protein [Bacillus phage SDFMU_Pbc]